MTTTVEEVRALLRDFAKSPWRELHFRSGGWEAFFAKTGSGPNPLLRKSHPASVQATAPHLGMVKSLLAAGSQVAAGAVIATLDVLGRPTEIVAEAAGRVDAWQTQEGALVEYGEPLLTIAPA